MWRLRRVVRGGPVLRRKAGEAGSSSKLLAVGAGQSVAQGVRRARAPAGFHRAQRVSRGVGGCGSVLESFEAMALGVDHPGVATLQLELEALARAAGRLSPNARLEDRRAVPPRFVKWAFRMAHSRRSDPCGGPGAQLDANAAVLGGDGQIGRLASCRSDQRISAERHVPRRRRASKWSTKDHLRHSKRGLGGHRWSPAPYSPLITS